jgi:branched-chain amino acid transport system substrate-binding protein
MADNQVVCAEAGGVDEKDATAKKSMDDFKVKFKKKFNADVQIYAPYVYDAVMVMADAMKRANSVEPAKFLPAIGKTKYAGVTANIEFDDKGDLKDGAISLYQYKGGKLEFVETLGGAPVTAATPATAAAPAAAAPAPAAAAPAAAPAPADKK